jgi:hypothetical protein
MKNLVKLAGIIALATVIGFTMMGCSEPTEENNYVPPEDRPVKDRWWKGVGPESTATLDYSVAGDGVCTITVGGIPIEDRWKAHAGYSYTAQAGTRYVYTFEAWTESGERELSILYYYDDDEEIYLGVWQLPITNTRTTYTVRGQGIPKGGVRPLEFQCADQTGTFYVKILKIEELKIGKLTITNFSGSPGPTKNSWVEGFAQIENDDVSLYFGGDIINYYYTIDNNTFLYSYPEMIQITGSSVTLLVWEESYDEEIGERTLVPFTGNVTVAAGDLGFISRRGGYDENLETYYKNIVPITLKNGNATINFGTQMKVVEYEDE